MNKIELNINAAGQGQIKLNGADVRCQRISIVSRAGHPSYVRLTLLADVAGSLEVERLATHRPTEEPSTLQQSASLAWMLDPAFGFGFADEKETL